MRVGLTGGSGFIGGYITRALASAGHSVIVFDHHSRIDRAVLDGLPDQETVTKMLGDVRDETAVSELAAHVDGIIHLAAVLGTQETIHCPTPSAQTNILGALNIFEAANRYDLPVVYAGVGNAWMRDHGTGSYTISKTAAEDYTRMYNAYRGGRITTVRPVNAYGPRQSVAAPYGASKVRKIIPSFTCRALAGDPIEVYGDGSQISDCVYVGDVARVFAAALDHTATHGPTARPVEVGPSTSRTVLDIAQLVAKTTAVPTRRASEAEIVHLPMRPGEVPNAVVSADVSTLSQIGVSADEFVSLEDGIARTVAWYAQHWLPTWERRAK